MAGKERMRLTDAAIARLRPREREYTVWDTRVPGLGVRVRPSGGRSYVVLEETDGRSKRVSLGPVSLKKIDEVRREGHARRASPEPERGSRPTRRRPVLAGVRGGRVEASLFRPLQAFDEKGRPVRSRRPHTARLRFEAYGPHCSGTGQALVR